PDRPRRGKALACAGPRPPPSRGARRWGSMSPRRGWPQRVTHREDRLPPSRTRPRTGVPPMIMTPSNGAVREGHRHERVAFTTSGQLEYFSEKELRAQIGFPAHAWPVALMKELLDNGLDAAEAADLPPAVNVEVGSDYFL